MEQGWFWLWLLIIVFGLIGTAMAALTILGAARAWRNQDIGWVAIIFCSWVVAMGWAAALFYLIAVDAKRQVREGPPGVAHDLP
jgi:hypothetical protein